MSDELSKLKAEMTALSDLRKAKQKERAAASELKTLKQRHADNTAIAEAEEKLGEQGVHCAAVETPDGRVVILKRAPYALFREFQEKKNANTDELETLVEACLYYPDADTFEKIQEEYPGLLTVFVKAILKLAGALQEDAAKK